MDRITSDTILEPGDVIILGRFGHLSLKVLEVKGTTYVVQNTCRNFSQKPYEVKKDFYINSLMSKARDDR